MGNMLVAATAVLFILFSPQVMQAASAAAQVFVSGVLPALFPMMILNGLSASHAAAPGQAAVVAVLFAFGAGSPASSQRLRQLNDQGILSQRGFDGLAAATGVMSPMFIVGTLSAKTGLHRATWGLLCVHWLSALLVGGVWWLVRGRARHGGADKPIAAPLPHAPTPSLAAALPAAVSAAAQALLSVCGAMMFFSIIAAVTRTLLGFVFPQWVARNSRLLAVFWALMEIGGGSYAVLEAFPAPPLALLCALLSFGGLSIWLQNLLFIGKIIRPGKLLLMRTLHGATAYGLCQLWFFVLPEWRTAFRSCASHPIQDGSNLLAISLIICLLALACPRRASP